MSKQPIIIEVSNLLKAKVSYGPGGVDAKKLEETEAMIRGLQSEYVVWVLDDLKKLQVSLEAALMAGTDDRAAPVRQIFETAHDMKGQGGSFDYGLMTQVSAQLCSFIDSRTIYSDQDMEVIRLHVDALRLVIAQKMVGDGGGGGKGLLRGLQAVISKIGS
ncbi:MAG TPA: Hpt domain-containing protein [Rhodospirillaceae bacterium]|nr:Hpt domain-containing protein [Rhodospirillaceae bacterium]